MTTAAPATAAPAINAIGRPEGFSFFRLSLLASLGIGGTADVRSGVLISGRSSASSTSYVSPPGIGCPTGIGTACSAGVASPVTFEPAIPPPSTWLIVLHAGHRILPPGKSSGNRPARPHFGQTNRIGIVFSP